MRIVHELKELASGYTILLVDDNTKLRDQLEKFLERFFLHVVTASDGDTGITSFQKELPDIVLTDIQMPEKNGLEMIKTIKSINEAVPIVIMSAFDKKEYLKESIRYGVADYLTKPTKINILCEVLVEALKKLKMQLQKKLFERYTLDLFEKQNCLIALYEKNTPVIVNPAFLEFFDVSSVDMFLEMYIDIGLHFLRQDDFLYSSDEDWFSQVSRQSGVHFHVKMADRAGKHHHFLLKYIQVSDNDEYGLVILDDITELNLLSLFNMEDLDDSSDFFGDEEMVANVLNLLQRESLDVKVYNFYKGLSITNPAKVLSYQDRVITLEVNKNQIIASKYEKHLIIGSNSLPHFIWCDEILSCDDTFGYIKATNLKFMRSNPTKRKNIRLEPDKDYKISLFFKLKEFLGDISIVDISIDGIKLKVNSLLVGMRDTEPLEIVMTLGRKSENITLEFGAKIIRIDKYDTYYYVIVEFELETKDEQLLISYISKRQIQLIREFKSLEFKD